MLFFYCPLVVTVSLFMFFIDLPRRYFSSRESIGQTLPGLEHPRRYVPLDE